MIRLLKYSKCSVDQEHIQAFTLDRPLKQSDFDQIPFGFQGWIVSSRHVYDRVEIVVNQADKVCMSVDLARPDVIAVHPDSAAGDKVGFFGYLNPLVLPRTFQISLFAVADNAPRQQLYSLEGERHVPARNWSMQPRPVFLTTLGRSGSNITCAILGAHPEITLYRTHGAEAQYAAYWTQQILNLGNPQSWLGPLAAGMQTDPHWTTGHWISRPVHNLATTELCQWFNNDYQIALGSFFLQQLQNCYRELSQSQGKPSARYFCEKLLPNRFAEMVLETIPEAKEVILVRDFRDIIASVLAFNRKRGSEKFGRAFCQSDAEYITNYAKPVVAGMAKAWQDRSATAFLLKYEDLMQDTAGQIRKLFHFLEIDSGESQVVGAIERAYGRHLGRQKAHQTSPDAFASIGSYRSRLSPELIAMCNESFRSGLQTFGYPI